jgi:hypothetical protein
MRLCRCSFSNLCCELNGEACVSVAPTACFDSGDVTPTSELGDNAEKKEDGAKAARGSDNRNGGTMFKGKLDG